jgi:hypothetical protein
MDDRYIEQKQKEIVLFFNAITTIEQRKKFLKLLLEAVWLGGKVEGVQEARKVIK